MINKILRSSFILFFASTVLHGANRGEWKDELIFYSFFSDPQKIKCKIETKEDFQQWVELRLLGKADYCEEEGDIFDSTMKKLGFNVNIIRDLEGLYEGEVDVSGQLIAIFGYKLKKYIFPKIVV